VSLARDGRDLGSQRDLRPSKLRRPARRAVSPSRWRALSRGSRGARCSIRDWAVAIAASQQARTAAGRVCRRRVQRDLRDANRRGLGSSAGVACYLYGAECAPGPAPLAPETTAARAPRSAAGRGSRRTARASRSAPDGRVRGTRREVRAPNRRDPRLRPLPNSARCAGLFVGGATRAGKPRRCCGNRGGRRAVGDRHRLRCRRRPGPARHRCSAGTNGGRRSRRAARARGPHRSGNGQRDAFDSVAAVIGAARGYSSTAGALTSRRVGWAARPFLRHEPLILNPPLAASLAD
jgi:hypothetical protein